MDEVRFELEGAVGRIVLAQPPANAISRSFVDALISSASAAGLSDARVLLILAEGENFGTGGEITEWPDKNRQWFTTFIRDANSAFKAIEALRVPTMAVVQGACISGHFELALHCDLIIAADDALFTWIEAKAAMAPLAGGIQRLAERVGRARALRFVMLAETLTAAEALALGIVAQTCPAAELHARSVALAEQLAQGPTQAFAAMRALLKAWATGGLGAADALMLDLTMDLFNTEDSRRAFRSISDAVRRQVAPPQLSFLGR